MTTAVQRAQAALARPPRADLALAGVLAAGGLVEVALTADGPLWLLWPLVLVTVVPVAYRRRAPFAALALALVAVAVGVAAGYPGNATYLLVALVVVFYSLGAWLDAREGAVRACFGLAAIAALVGWNEPGLDNVVFVVLVYGGAFLVGSAVRRPRQRAGELERRSAALDAEREAAAQRAVEQERARIARELHDVVAHSVSVMVIQAGAVRRRLEASQERERDALVGVEHTGRDALSELRRMLGVLRSEGQGAELGPQPGAGELEALAEQVRAAGLAVRLHVEGADRLPPGPGLAVYRVVQEALTNTLKHANATTSEVSVRVGARAVEVEVRDDGRGATAANGSPGHGLIGMRERVALYGGSLTAGPAAAGGFAVSARLQWDGDGSGQP